MKNSVTKIARRLFALTRRPARGESVCVVRDATAGFFGFCSLTRRRGVSLIASFCTVLARSSARAVNPLLAQSGLKPSRGPENGRTLVALDLVSPAVDVPRIWVNAC